MRRDKVRWKWEKVRDCKGFGGFGESGAGRDGSGIRSNYLQMNFEKTAENTVFLLFLGRKAVRVKQR